MPASYPTSVKTFANKASGQTIDAAHVNDLQDEVNAIEAGLLNGTAPLTSSNTVVNALAVSSGSTFSGPVTINGPVAFTANVRLGSTTVTLPTGDSTALDLSSGVVQFIASTGGSTSPISTIAGITRSGKATGHLVLLLNTGSPTIQIVHANSSVTSTNQIALPNGQTVALQTHESIGLVYDGSLWRVFSRADG